MPSSSSIDPEHGVAFATELDPSTAVVPSRRPEDFASFLRTQDNVDAICEEHGVPKEFTARPAGDLSANSKPPPGAICVYSRALEAGMPVPLHGFFREALAHFGIAPTQVTPNGWRIMAGFLVLCSSVGVPPSLAVFRHFFLLSIVCQMQKKGWYFFRSRKSSSLRFTGFPNPNWASFKNWKHEFFFLSSPEPWHCPLEWGEPSERSFKNPVLTNEENKSAAKLLRAYGGAAVDLRTYLCNRNLAAGMMSTALVPAPPRPSASTCIVSIPQGMDPAVYDMMKTLLAEKAAAQESASVKKAEPSSDSNGKKRSLQEANGEQGPPFSMQNTLCVYSPPPDTTDTEAARGLLEGAVVLSPDEPSDAVILQATDYTSLSLSYALELEEKLAAQERDSAALREQLVEAKSELASAKRSAKQEKEKAELAAAGAVLAKANAGLAEAEAEVVKAKAELTVATRAADASEQKARPERAMEVAMAKAKLAAAKRALEAELESVKAAAVQQLLCCEENVRRRAEQALQGYQRWRTGRAPAVVPPDRLVDRMI